MENRHKGFTLFELMMGIGVMAILAAIAVPSFQEFGRNSRVNVASGDLTTALNSARAEAIRRSMPVTVCPTINFSTCSAAVANWPRGWMSFTDATGAFAQRDGTDQILQIWEGPGVVDTSWLASHNNVRFLPTGLVTPTVNKWFIIESASCAAGSAQRAMRTTVNGIGAIRTERVACL